MKPILEPVGIVLRDKDVVVEVEGDPSMYAYLPTDAEEPEYRRIKISPQVFAYMREVQQGEFVRLPDTQRIAISEPSHHAHPCGVRPEQAVVDDGFALSAEQQGFAADAIAIQSRAPRQQDNRQHKADDDKQGSWHGGSFQA
jgi:hypothetical protein